MRSNYEKLGPYIQQVNVRNQELSVINLQGISIDKYFMPSVANILGTDLTKYKVVAPRQFAFNPMHVGRDEVLPISMLDTDDKIIVSPAYTVFMVKDESKLLPEYLMMWCRRPEFDRNVWFTTDSSVRGGFKWEDFCDLQLPIPSIEKQRQIVQEYQTVTDRIKLNEELNQKLEETAQEIYKQWFVEFEFPMTKEDALKMGNPEFEGKPYKASGGPMVWNDELEQEVPEGWESGIVLDMFELQRGFDLPVQDRETGIVPIVAANGIVGYHLVEKVKGPVVITGRSGTIGNVLFVSTDCWPLNTTLWTKKLKLAKPLLCYFMLKKIDLLSLQSGSAVPTLNRNDIHKLRTLKPDVQLIKYFERQVGQLFNHIDILKSEIASVNFLTQAILSKMSTVGVGA